MDQRELVVDDAALSSAPTLAAHPPSRLATPFSLALVIPLLVLVSGLGVGFLAWSATARSARVQAGTALIELSLAKRDQADLVLNGGGAILDALRLAMAAGPDLADDRVLVRSLLPIMRGRSGLALLHVTYPDGRWYALAREDGGRRAVRLRRASDGSAVQVSLPIGPDGAPCGPETAATRAYDPLARDFWRSATGAGRRVWTDAYVFAGSGLPGISLCEPVFGPDGRLAMVLTADFDLVSLGSGLSGGGDLAVTTALFAADRSLLSAPPAWGRREGRLLRAGDLDDPGARAFFASLADKGLPAAGAPPLAMGYRDEHGREWGAAVAALPLADGPTWYVARIADRAFLLGRSDEIVAGVLPLALGVLALGVGAGLWFALHLSRARREAERQGRRADDAERQVRALGSYRLTRLLGRGGMGEVWLAEHRLLARPAAVKLITAKHDASPEKRQAAKARFDREARITASLTSRATIRLFDYGVAADGTWYYVMELLDGKDLQELVAEHGPLPVGRIVHLLVQACGSLAEAHDHGLVHRDIKPENLYACRLADEVDVLKVLDFGIVAETRTHEGGGRGEAPLTRAGYVCGTPTTMAPEQARGDVLDGRSDLYALGCVAYWLATGTEVFSGDGFEMVAKHLRSQPDSLSLRAGRSLPPAFESLVLSCLAKDREQRPADARALAAALLALDLPFSEHWDAAMARAWWAEHLPRKARA